MKAVAPLVCQTPDLFLDSRLSLQSKSFVNTPDLPVVAECPNMNREDPPSSIAARKSQHLDLVLHEAVEFERSSGLERFEFVHEALPELSLESIDTTTTFLKKRLSAPLLVSSMTGGTERAGEINQRIAKAVAELGLGMGVGSQRISAEQPEVLSTFQVRQVAPEVLLIANLGAVQLNYGFTVDGCIRLVESIGADALALHLNPLQEAIQPEGDDDFRGLEKKINSLCTSAPFPIIVKEIGCGISAETAQRLLAAGVAAIDVGGAGGTCWADIEGRRSESESTRQIAQTFREWGIPTADAVRSIRQNCPKVQLIASGGLRSGLDVAKCLALGANVTAVAGPVLKAADQSDRAVIDLLDRMIRELKLAMFCTGSSQPSELSRRIREKTA